MDRGGPTIVAEPAPGRKEVCTNGHARYVFWRFFSNLPPRHGLGRQVVRRPLRTYT